MNIRKTLSDFKQNVPVPWKTPKGRMIFGAGTCIVAAIFICILALAYQSSVEAGTVKAKTPTVLKNASGLSGILPSSTDIQDISVTSSAPASSDTASSAASQSSSQSSSLSERKESSQPHYVTASPASRPSQPATSTPSTVAPPTKPAPSTVSHVANYQGINAMKTYTDEITGTPEVVQFLGVGAGYQETAIAEIQFQTTAAMGAAHNGIGTATLTGPVSHSSQAVVGKTGTCDLFTVANLTAGTYEVKLTAHDGTVVAEFHFSVDSGGIVK